MSACKLTFKCPSETQFCHIVVYPSTVPLLLKDLNQVVGNLIHLHVVFCYLFWRHGKLRDWLP